MEAPGGKGTSVVTDKNRQKFQEGMVSMKNIELKNIFRSKYVIRVAAGIVTVAVIGSSVGAASIRYGQGSRLYPRMPLVPLGKKGNLRRQRKRWKKPCLPGKKTRRPEKRKPSM